MCRLDGMRVVAIEIGASMARHLSHGGSEERGVRRGQAAQLRVPARLVGSRRFGNTEGAGVHDVQAFDPSPHDRREVADDVQGLDGTLFVRTTWREYLNAWMPLGRHQNR